jgi:hypothetical protein
MIAHSEPVEGVGPRALWERRVPVSIPLSGRDRGARAAPVGPGCGIFEVKRR